MLLQKLIKLSHIDVTLQHGVVWIFGEDLVFEPLFVLLLLADFTQFLDRRLKPFVVKLVQVQRIIPKRLV